ncbi:hypothetical protein SAMN05444008_110193 [Cnuella takakiae]|uniref:Uncharacterized protein n=1 Tax=Cnuella takakiae TaxID=1302690 RepID=A0A1M5DEG8_9BACT|nr:hypothetical protein [Cnuella takakiae]OLY93999.1 hypothetical protein BUE76_20510 [Cnuella takakiae]SHF65234.1 hypothetical protein SAMN05444008_110193 [Cnuella takakiae]
MATIQVQATMQSGSGFGVFVRIDNLNLFFDRSGVQEVELEPNFYVATIGGHEPSSATVQIDFIQETITIGSQTYNTPTFFGFIPFTVS